MFGGRSLFSRRVAGKGLLLRGVARQKNEKTRFRGGWVFFSEESPNRRSRKLGSDEQLGLVVGLYSPGESPVRAFCSEESPDRRTRKLGSVVVGFFSPRSRQTEDRENSVPMSS